jgi:flagellar motor protein MotB
LIIEGKGGSVPLASNDTDAGRAKNRRVEITLLR